MSADDEAVQAFRQRLAAAASGQTALIDVKARDAQLISEIRQYLTRLAPALDDQTGETWEVSMNDPIITKDVSNFRIRLHSNASTIQILHMSITKDFIETTDHMYPSRRREEWREAINEAVQHAVFPEPTRR